MRILLRGAIGLPITVLAAFASAILLVPPSSAVGQTDDTTSTHGLPDPDGNQYTGITRCAACHFPQFRDWKTSRHANAFNILPDKYKNDESCLVCHTSRIGDEFVRQTAIDAITAGVSCEGCHGPGGNHASFALSFVGQNRVMSEPALQELRSKIQRVALDQCIRCHISKAHKPHPKFERDPESAPATSSRSAARRFFQVHSPLATDVESRSLEKSVP